MANFSPNLIGIDVASENLDIARSGCAPTRIANTIETVGEWLDTLPRHCCIAIEATGSYHETVQTLAMAAGHEVYLINGKQLNHYREAVGPRAKTDSDDARLLLRYLTQEQAHLKPAKPLSLKEKRLWGLLQRRATLVKTKAQLKLSLRGDPEAQAIWREVGGSLKQGIARIDRVLKQLAKELGWATMLKQCQSIPGIGPLNALALVACFHRGEFKTSDQWIAYLGLDVRVRDSGATQGRRKLSKRGNPEVRRLLYNGAMSASKMPAIRPWCERYRVRGLSPTATFVILSRKLARIAFALLTKGEVYNAENSNLACSSP